MVAVFDVALQQVLGAPAPYDGGTLPGAGGRSCGGA